MVKKIILAYIVILTFFGCTKTVYVPSERKITQVVETRDTVVEVKLPREETTVPEPVAIVAGLKISSGVAGESINNPYTISTSASYNGKVFPQITFAVNSNGEIVSYNTADLAALIN